MAALIYRRAFSDSYGLTLLGSGEVPSISETRRRIFLAERRTDIGRPDHFYKGYLQHRLGDARDVSELPWIVLRSLAGRYLERRDGLVAVRYELFGEWHELLPFLSPLAVIIAFLVEEDRGPGPGVDPRPFLASEIGDTALIGAVDPGLEDIVRRKGLNELHMHLNGSTELDVLWPDACAAPVAVYAELKDAERKSPEPTAELYEQLEPGLTPYGIYRRLRAARRVRRHLVMELASDLEVGRADGRPATGLAALSEAAEFGRSDMDWPYPRWPALSLHPARVLFRGRAYRPIVEEAGFLYACLSALKRDPGHRAIGTGLYFNLLVLTQLARLAVQQVDESGFDQFQKYTLLGTRERIERRYGDRFRQLNVREPFQTLSHLEGRFAPKASAAGTCALITDIVKGYLEFRRCPHAKEARRLEGPPPPCLTGHSCGGEGCGGIGRPEAELFLVAHFIKRLPSARNDYARRFRDSDLRATLDEQARILCALVKGNATVRALLQGVDGASNELHAPPEPFAPAFRLVRRAGIPRATFHVGEDFRHLLSGIRAVAEALAFLDLQSGDRIGHATALGIDPALWLDRTAPRAVLSRLEALDNAVFAHRALAAIGGFAGDLLRLESLIAVHSDALYDAERSPDLLHRAWELRRLDPLAVRAVERSLQEGGRPATATTVAEEARFMASTTIDETRAAELRLVADTVARSGSAYELFSQRHALDPARAMDPVDIDAAVISLEAFAALQDHVLGLVNNRGVALETLPTSNLRISFYDEMAEHHLYRWLGLVGPVIVNRPTICVGSDDPGIFATNLRNEYAVIGSVLRHRFKLTSAEATRTLEKLNDNGRVHRFVPPGVGFKRPRDT
ncbi:hypothetical protein [Aureimonas phyllosphaerae]|uniref:Adenosine deaminase n=1 Tax=Aureimonas phyllosphaerae TaxID=1166078 RepID=A0A7W6BUH6_9HYPH|nr:hypothetical protein [Aureimonas phyllosphaerae]MBB3938258.1 adenosine deaminase [Aureimonas phyllosphaerae]MBB3962265.1 adenosine deaminase [Aureimonas phyllosphaerae]SFF59008.1 hypothetical protein SAMN05216566_1403 [Aureimonas phyllosphaerae]